MQKIGNSNRSENKKEQTIQIRKKDKIIAVLLGLYLVCALLVSRPLEQCPSELAGAITYTFLLLFIFLWIRKAIRTRIEESPKWIVPLIVWLLLFILYWHLAIRECTQGY